MTKNPARNHHYVPQFYLRNFAADGQVYAFNTKLKKLIKTNPRNIAGERDLYKLEGSEPQLAENMFSEIEGVITPILSKIISTEELPSEESDDFVSLLYFMALLVGRHPSLLTTIEDFTKRLMEKTVRIFAHHIPKDGKTLTDGQRVTQRQALDAIKALDEGRIKIHVPKDYSVVSALRAADGITETLMQRSWCLAVAQDNFFIATSKPVLLVWDDLNLHRKHSAGFGLRKTTVYFPISPKLLMLGKFDSLIRKCHLDMRATSAINGLHGFYSPQYLISQTDQSTILISSEHVAFKDLEKAFRKVDGP